MPNVTMIPATIVTSGKSRTTKNKRKVAGYARVSTDHDEQQTSFESQVRTYTDLINGRSDWELVGIYTDEGISGLSLKKRDGFNKMIQDALDGKIELIVTKSVSRFGRNTLDVLNTVRELKQKGIEIWFEKENLWSLDPQTEFLLSIMVSIAQEESRSISKNVSLGKQKLMAQGKGSIAYSIFLGYDKGPDGNLVINPDQAKIVKLIYSDFLKGLSYRGIGNHLELLGIKTPMGKDHWGIGTIQRILTNEKYKGDMLLGKTYIPDFLTKKQVKNVGQSPQYYVKGSHEPIIEPEVFDRVQEEVAARAEGRYNGKTIFSGKIFCGECGRAYGSKVHHSNDKYRKNIWRCNGKYEGKRKCQTPALEESDIRKAFLSVVNRVIDNKKDILGAVQIVLSEVCDTAFMEKERSEAVQELQVVTAMLNNDSNYPRGQDVSDETLNKKHAELYALQDKLARDIRKKKIKRQNIEQFIKAVEKLPDKIDKFDEVLWASFIEKVTVFTKEDIRFTLVTGEEIIA